MGEVFFLPQGVDHQNAASPDLLHLIGGNGVDIGQVSQVAAAESQHRQLMVKAADRGEKGTADGKGKA